MLLLAVLALGRRPALLRSREALVSELWFLLPGMAVTWFDPAEVKLWLIPMFGFWALLALALSSLGTTATRQRLVTVSLTTLVLFIALGNFLVPIWPNHRTPSRNLTTAQQAAMHLTQADLVISATFDWTLYLDYISDEYRIFHAIAVAQTHGRAAVRSMMKSAIQATFQQGGHVYVPNYFGAGHSELWKKWITPFTWLTPEDFAHYKRTVAWYTTYDDVIWELSPQP
jgi:hypothetical protein